MKTILTDYDFKFIKSRNNKAGVERGSSVQQIG